MDTTLFSNVKKLYDYELYSDVIPLASLLHTAYKNCPTILTSEQEYQLLLFEANSYYYERQYRNADLYFRQVIQMRKNLLKQKNSTIIQLTETQYEHFNDIEIKYRLAICLKEINRSYDAITILQSITNKLRTPKINMLLAKLQHYGLKENCASLAYKDVLRECPLALDAIKSLLELGVSGIEVNSVVVNVSSGAQCSDWLSNWIKGHDLMYKQKFLQAIDAFKLINQSSKIRNNEYILVLIGECYYYNGSYDNALRFLQQVNIKKPLMADGIQALAVLYSKKNKLNELEKLMPTLTICEYKAEHWFVLAQCLYTAGKYGKSAYFAQKSIYSNSRNIEAYLLKVKIYFELKKYCEALTYLRNAQNISHWRFEIYKGLVNCYLAQNRLRDAQTVAAHAVRIAGQTPRSLVLLARSLLRDPMMKSKMKSFLTQALEIDEYYFPAVSLLAEILLSENDTSGAICLIKKQVTTHPNCKLYSMLGDILYAEKDFEKAFDNYTIALNLDPKNPRALAGLNALGHSSKNNLNKQQQDESSSYSAATTEDEPIVEYYSEIELANALINEAESESETLWSDVEVDNHN